MLKAVAVLAVACQGQRLTQDPLGEWVPTSDASLYSTGYISGLGPLPGSEHYYLEEQAEDGSSLKRLAFRAYDFNHDQRPDMLEVFNKAGQVKAILFDFNFDGRVDKTEVMSEKLKEVRQALPKDPSLP